MTPTLASGGEGMGHNRPPLCYTPPERRHIMEILYLILGFLLLPWFLVTTITFLAGVSF